MPNRSVAAALLALCAAAPSPRATPPVVIFTTPKPPPIPLIRYRAPNCTRGWTVKIFFVRDESTVSDEVAGLLVENAADNVLACRPARVDVVGHADVGEADSIATARAETVRTVLIKRGVTRDLIKLASQGSNQLAAPAPSVQNRRVTITLTYR